MSKGDLCSIDRRLVKAAKLVISDVKFYDFPNVFTNRCEAAVQKLLTKLPDLWCQYENDHKPNNEWDDSEGDKSDEHELDGMARLRISGTTWKIQPIPAKIQPILYARRYTRSTDRKSFNCSN